MQLFEVGDLVQLTINIDPHNCLFNGTVGVIQRIIYEKNIANVCFISYPTNKLVMLPLSQIAQADGQFKYVIQHVKKKSNTTTTHPIYKDLNKLLEDC